MLELERVHSHLPGWVWPRIIGFDTVLMQAWRIREFVMWLTSRSRKSKNLRHESGRRVRRDIDAETADKILKTLAKIEEEAKELVAAAVEDNSLKMRLEKVGMLSKEDVRFVINHLDSMDNF